MNCRIEAFTDASIEKLWCALEDAATYEDEEGELRLLSPFFDFEAGTSQIELWDWFDRHHSIGVGYLLNEYEMD